MQRIIKDLPYSCEIIFTGDTHWGSYFTHEDGIDFLVDYVRSKPNRFLIHMGDWIEAITVDDKRFDPRTTDEPIPDEQANQISDEDQQGPQYTVHPPTFGITVNPDNHEDPDYQEKKGECG